MARSELLQYDIRHDRKEKDVQFIAKQLETHLRERFNVLISTVEYGIKDGHLARQGTEEPFIESIKRGRDVIQRIDPNSMDVNRENAEVIGFEKIDSFLADPVTRLNSKMLSISPQGEDGSKYQHNFYDIFTLKKKNGERYVELSRYSSALSRRDYAKRFGLNSDNPPQAAEFLRNPLDVSAAVTAEQIHESLHTAHDYMMPSDFEEIWTSPKVKFYAARYELNRDANSFNAFLNAADEVWENKNKREKGQLYGDYLTYNPSYGEIKYLEKKEVRQAGGQCPGKSGASTKDSPFSVSEFGNYGSDKYGERAFKCPECGKTNVRPEDELLKNCQHCNSTKVAC